MILRSPQLACSSISKGRISRRVGKFSPVSVSCARSTRLARGPSSCTVNKAQLVEKIAELVGGRKIPQITDVRDESTDEVRIVLELKGDASDELAMAHLCKHTPLQT